MNRATDAIVKDYVAGATPEELDALKLLIFARERELEQRTHELEQRRKKFRSASFHLVKESTKSHIG